jgi:hypothetical protein
MFRLSELPQPRVAFGQSLSEDGLLAALRAENAGRSFSGGDEHAGMMLAAGLDAVTINDPAQVKLAIADQRKAVDEASKMLAQDDASGVFGRMKKKDRQAIEAWMTQSERHVVLLDAALLKAEERVATIP